MNKTVAAVVVLAFGTLALSAQSISGPSYSPSATRTEIAEALPGPVAVPMNWSSSADGTQISASPAPAPKPTKKVKKEYRFKTLSRVALGVGFNPGMGIADYMGATNITPWMNLRATGRLLNYTYSQGFSPSNGITVKPTIHFESVQISGDVMPFPRHSNFHVSPGFLFDAHNTLSGPVTLAARQTMTLNDVTYTAQTPITGTFAASLSHKTHAATLGIGFGNLLPRRGSHWSVPIDVGVAFVGAPTAQFNNLSGMVCDPSNNCGDINSSTAFSQMVQANIAAQEKRYVNDVYDLKYYPNVSLGLAYNFKIRK